MAQGNIGQEEMNFEPPVNITQLQLLLTAMEKNGDLSKPIRPGVLGRMKTQNLWVGLTERLNSAATCGNRRTSDKWKQVWIQWKTRTIKKSVAIELKTNDSDNDDDDEIRLTDFEKRILKVINKKPAIKQEFVARSPLVTLQELRDIGIHVPTQTEDDNFMQFPSPAPNMTPELSSRERRRRRNLSRRSAPLVTALRANKHVQTDKEWPTNEQVETHLENRRICLGERRAMNEEFFIKIERRRNNILSRFADMAEAVLAHFFSTNV